MSVLLRLLNLIVLITKLVVCFLAPTAAATRPSSATRIRTSRSASTSVVHNNTANNNGNSHSGTGSSVLHNTVLSKALSTPRHIPLMQIPTDAVGMDSFASPGKCCWIMFSFHICDYFRDLEWSLTYLQLCDARVVSVLSQM